MATIAERTKHVFCRPTADGGSGDTAPQTAVGVVACIRATCRHAFGSGELRGRRIGIHGLGQVGANIAHMLAPTGASLLVADIDPARRSIADALGAAWTGPERLLTAELDVLVPAALGGVLTAELVPRLNCTTIVGPANNQLAGPDVADRLLRRGIAWAPDYVVGAGGALYAITRELHAAGHTEAIAKVTQIGDTLAEILATARQAGVSPDHTARALAERRLRGAAQPFT
jgi:leucine dehydrogenase